MGFLVGTGRWKRSYGTFYTGTKVETSDTAKECPTGLRASARPYQATRGGSFDSFRRPVAIRFTSPVVFPLIE